MDRWNLLLCSRDVIYLAINRQSILKHTHVHTSKATIEVRINPTKIISIRFVRVFYNFLLFLCIYFSPVHFYWKQIKNIKMQNMLANLSDSR